MKEFLELKKALNCGLIVTPDKGTKNEKGSYIATRCEQLGDAIFKELESYESEDNLYLSSINPAQMTRREVKVSTSCDAIIEVYDGPEDIQGVRVQALGEDFVIGLHDIDDGKDNFKYDEAMTRLKELNLSTFNRKQAAIICIYIDQINDKLVEAGGEAFAEDWYTTNELYIPKEKRSSADYYATYTWFFNGASGCLSNYVRYRSFFRCRPSLALPFQN